MRRKLISLISIYAVSLVQNFEVQNLKLKMHVKLGIGGVKLLCTIGLSKGNSLVS